MLTVVSAEEMRWCDETTIRRFHVPGFLLMDRAGTAAAHWLLRHFAPLDGRPVVIVCGPGNNGGDGFVVARVFANHGAHVRVVLTSASSALRGDAATHFSLLRHEARANPERLSIVPFARIRNVRFPAPALVVDAVFGTGFQGAPRGVPAKAIAWINALGAPIASLDVPSGVDASTGLAQGVSVRAAATVTFGLLKTGLLLNDGRERAGQVACVDIGLPSSVTGERRFRTRMVQSSDLRSVLVPRPHRLHKYAAGKVLLIAGSRGYTGAATLAAMGALRSGAGAVVVAHPESIHSVLSKKLTEPILQPLPSSSEGSLSLQALPAVLERCRWADAVVVGPGLGRTASVQAFIEALFEECDSPMVVDADALTMLAGMDRRRWQGKDWILTPHAGECGRLAGVSPEEVENDRVETARVLARRQRRTIVLKGSPTCTASPEGLVAINSTGNAGMATVGSGDVLAGIVGGLRAQGIDAFTSAWTGAWLHGRAGDRVKASYGGRSLLAGDLLDQLPQAFRDAGEPT
ncbi:MAG: NAD(P)H-hydrate dehydratase [Bacteroidetes bacterium]|jgi:NAD(P)H-hydrate epimerase|nr:NAD(P)H-hydrate dehydratase [Bacteroidota bacterium]